MIKTHYLVVEVADTGPELVETFSSFDAAHLCANETEQKRYNTVYVLDITVGEDARIHAFKMYEATGVEDLALAADGQALNG